VNVPPIAAPSALGTRQARADDVVYGGKGSAMKAEAAPRYAITVEEVPDELIASVTGVATFETIGAVVQGAFASLGPAIGAADAFADGPPGLIVLKMGGGEMTVEVFMPVDHAFEVSDRIALRRLDGGRVVTAVHEGPYDEIGGAYQALTAWIADHRAVSSGPPRERYLNDPHTVGQDAARTRVEFPIA
jgi:effector-binding domain-containing protein